MNQQVASLFQRVATRQRVISMARWFYLLTLWLAGAYAVLLMVSRFVAVIPDYFTPPTLLIVIALAMALALILHKKPTVTQTARTIDTRTGAKDLFLTAALIEKAPGEYAPLVMDEAVKKAGEVRPQTVTPFDFWPQTGKAAAALIAVLLAAMFLPQLDPWGHEAARKKEADKKQRLVDSVKAATARAQVLAQQPLDAERSKEVEATLAQVAKTFNSLKPNDPANNIKRLSEQQTEVGKLWQKQAEEKLRDQLDKSLADQKVGSPDLAKSQQWQNDIQNGKTDSLQQEAKDLEKLAEKMAKETNPAAKESQRKELEKRLAELTDFTNKQLSKSSLNEALNRAQQQAGACNNPSLSSDAAKAVAQSMKLTQSELKQAAQAMQDAKALNEAMQAIQAAKQAGSEGKPLDGQASKGTCNSMNDYAKMYSQMCNGGGKGNGKGDGQDQMSMKMRDMLAKSGQGGNGEGMGKPGIGNGGRRPENPNAEVAFKPEKSESAVLAGKNLLEWKDKGVSESGTASKDYAQSIQDLKQGVSEAILKEEIPPGYHDAIQKYFDSVEQVAPKPGSAPANAPANVAANAPAGDSAK